MVNRIIAVVAATLAIAGAVAVAQEGSASGPYKVLRTARVGGEGGFDYVYADSDGRRLYVPRSGPSKRISVFDLDTLQPMGEIPDVGAHGVAVDPNSHHGFASSKPVAMWDTNTMKVTKSIDVQGNPDGILFRPLK
jgi:DNA-binding beta-propeller fold protein YncE